MPHDSGRRAFLRTTLLAGGGFLMGIQTVSCSDGNDVDAGEFRPNVWLAIHPDNRVIVTISKSEMGQGIRTALAMLVAEELDADWNSIEVVQAITSSRYGSMYTGGSTSVRDMWQPLREAGASARMMILQAAATKWNADPGECRTSNGQVIHEASGRRLDYGKLTREAGMMPVPENPVLKTKAQFNILGQSLPRIDNVDQVTGRAIYGIDQNIPDLKYAAIRHAPVFGAQVAEFDKSALLTQPGIRAVVNLQSAIAVVADSYWQAQTALDALSVKWHGGDIRLSDDVIRQDYQALLLKPGEIDHETGGLPGSGVATQITAHYEAGFQAHATMEPMNCTVRFVDDICEIWVPTQNPQAARGQAKEVLLSRVDKLINKSKEVLGIGKDAIQVHTTLIGGGFGRRLEQDYVEQAVRIAHESKYPIKLIWSRSEDIQHDFYRPFTSHQLEADLDSQGNIMSWRHRIAGPIRGRSIGGAYLPYDVPHYRLDFHLKEHAVPIGSWRSVGSAHNAFVTECFIDELAYKAGSDPYQYRRSLLLKNNPRVLAVLDHAATLMQWGQALPPGHGLGIAVHDGFGSVVCQIAEVFVNGNKTVVKRICCVVDCGTVVNPEIVTSQIESGVVFGLTAALKSRITISKGRVEQSNFHDFRLMRINEMPEIDVHIMPSERPPGGVGEIGVPPAAPAVANAIFAVTGKRLRALPLLGS